MFTILPKVVAGNPSSQRRALIKSITDQVTITRFNEQKHNISHCRIYKIYNPTDLADLPYTDPHSAVSTWQHAQFHCATDSVYGKHFLISHRGPKKIYITNKTSQSQAALRK
jgi:alpha-D-ribose 1-methylphosphonate 5-phosphate C-P lyase